MRETLAVTAKCKILCAYLSSLHTKRRRRLKRFTEHRHKQQRDSSLCLSLEHHNSCSSLYTLQMAAVAPPAQGGRTAAATISLTVKTMQPASYELEVPADVS